MNRFGYKQYYVSLGLVLVLLGFALINHSSVASSPRPALRLELPEVSRQDQQKYLPQPYRDIVAGEFLDVDLPDDLKTERYGDPGELQNRYTVQIAIYPDKEQAEQALQRLSEEDDEVRLVVLSDRLGRLSYQLHLGHYPQPAQAHLALLDIRNMFPDALRILKY